jgi:CubicO group peptidase (beta-lactamase class C family)
MNARKLQQFFNILVLLVMLTACAGVAPIQAVYNPTYASEDIADIIAPFQERIPQEMQERGIPGMAVVLVDDQGILWEETFGYTDWDRRIPITPSTIFSIQSTSKSFTATAAMFAAQDGLVDLDEPITTYLPDFRVHSIFEEHPEQKMTLRILLSCTAGFPHDAPYGGNYDISPHSFERHIASISDTWLMFPVGTRFSYSNTGIDLAGYILQVRSGMPFPEYVKKKVLEPLGMKDTTLYVNRVRSTTTRAIGHVESPMQPSADIQMIPSGGVWTSAEDIARYVQFHINKGVLDGKRLLREDLAETMYTPPNVPANRYALGLIVDPVHGVRQLQHGGGGFGFIASMAWYPELKLGAVVLTNSHGTGDHAYNLGQAMLDSIIDSNWELYADRMANARHSEPAYLPSRENTVLSDDRLQSLIESKALPYDAAAQQRRNDAVGTYIISSYGSPNEIVEIRDSNGRLEYTYDGEEDYLDRGGSLTEVQPGVYFTQSGLAFELLRPAPLYSEIPLVKADPQGLPYRAAFYALCGLLFLSALLIWPARAIARGIRRKRSQMAQAEGEASPHSGWLVWAEINAALASLFSLLCLAAIILIPNLVYFPWPRPWVDLAWWWFALIGLPFANLALAALFLLTAVLSMRRSDRARSARWYYLVVSLALLVFNGLILLG